MATLIIPTGNYIKFVASGPIPDCIGNTWKQIWDSDIPRTYQADFEIYDERSKNWKDGQVDIYIGIQS
jgi:predicted transcriptional regulator YdeE